MKADRYYYIGKDGKTVLARDLKDQRDALASENAALRAQLSTARDDALEEAANMVEQKYIALGRYGLRDAIRALKGSTS